MLSLTLFCALALAAAAPPALAAPRPPCAAPSGIVPAVPESMCSSLVAPANAAGVAVRSYGVPASELLVTDMTPGNFAYGDVVNISISNILLYLEADNSARRDYLAARTAPITVRPPGADGWLVSMMVSTVTFPDPARVPTPNNFEMHLEPVGCRLFAALAFNTTALPSEAEFKDACARLARGVPKGYSVVSDGWSPTYVLYSPRDAALWTNECWTQVELKAAGEGAA